MYTLAAPHSVGLMRCRRGGRYRVTLLGSRKTGKTALSHFMINGDKIIQHVPTAEIDMRYMQVLRLTALSIPQHPRSPVRSLCIKTTETASLRSRTLLDGPL